MKTKLPLILGGLMVIGGVALYLLGRPQPTEEERIRTVVFDAQEAVNNRQAGRLLSFVSEKYEDSLGNNKRSLTRLVVSALRSTEQYAVMVEIRQLDLRDESATVSLDVRLWMGEGLSTRTSEFPLNLSLAREGRHWRIIRAEGYLTAQDTYMNPY